MKYWMYFFFVVIACSAIFYTGCKKDGLRNCAQHSVSECVEKADKANIRFKNVSNYDFCNVILNPYDEETWLGIVDVDGATCYRAYEEAYSSAYIELSIGEKEFVFQPIDFWGFPLEAGYYTYEVDVLDFNERILSIVFVED